MRDRNWFSTCGTCGCETWGANPDDVPYVMDSLVVHELGWCGCGNPEEVDRMMLAYLNAIDQEDFPKPPAEGVSKDAERLIAYLADDLDWTEHGGTIGGAWLTENGIEAKRNLSAAVAAFAARS